MSQRERILSVFRGKPDGGPLYLPDLTLWARWHHERNMLPAGWEPSLLGAARALGVPAWIPVRPWGTTYDGVMVREHSSSEERRVIYETGHGTLSATWTLGPDGDWWQTEYPVKSRADLPAALEVVQARSYALRPDQSAKVTLAEDDAIVALELPMRPFSDILHTLLGWGDGFTLLFGEGKAILHEIVEVLEAKLRTITAAVAQLPGDVLFAPDNLDGQYVSPKVYREFLAASYTATVAAGSANDKPLVVHAGATVRRLLPLLAESGATAVEGIAGPPQGDAALPSAREAAGPGLVLWGGIPQDFLVDLHSWDAFAASVREAGCRAREDGAVIVGVADRVPVDADSSRLRAIPELLADSC